MLRTLLLCLLGSILLAAASSSELTTASPTAVPLPTDLAIDPHGISISGLSSGADFAVQFQVAFSSLIMGSGVFAGQPYHCAVTRFAHDPLKNATNPSVPICEGCPAGTTLGYDHCKNWAWTERGEGFVDVDRLASYARNQSRAGAIDDVRHLRRARVYLYRGTKDATYQRGSVDNNRLFFKRFLAADEQILFQNTTPSAHSWPTLSYGTPCGKGVIEACGYDGPGTALQHIYAGAGTLRPPAPSFDAASLFEYDQSPFFGDHTRTGLNNSGWIYVPKACSNTSTNANANATIAGAGAGACKLHLSLHGCGVNGYYDPAVHHLGFENWAESNGMVIMFPRMAGHGNTTQTHDGCWDAYAQSGADYALRTGAQMAAVRNMIRTVARV